MAADPRRCLTRQLRRLGWRPLLASLLVLLVIASLLAPHAGQADRADNLGVGRAVGDVGAKLDAAAISPKRDSPAPTFPPPPSAAPPPPTHPPLIGIPKRFHHYFGDSVSIPEQLTQAVNSWANNHKDYDVYFWDSRYLEKRLFPGLQLFRKYSRCHQAERHTVARLLILLTLGGVLVDPDLISLRDFSTFLDGSTCVVAQERPEVAALAFGLDSLPSLRFAACRPGHPFLRRLLDSFCAEVATRGGRGSGANATRGSVEGTAAATAAAVRAAFDAAVAAYDDDCAGRVCDHRDRVVLADAGVFLPVVAAPLRERLLAECAEKAATLGDSQRWACQSLSDPANRNLPSVISLAKPLAPAGPEDRRWLSLDRIGPNVRRKATANLLLPGV